MAFPFSAARFKSYVNGDSFPSVTVKNRKLWAEAKAFA
jgi:hypothetical protein